MTNDINIIIYYCHIGLIFLLDYYYFKMKKIMKASNSFTLSREPNFYWHGTLTKISLHRVHVHYLHVTVDDKGI